MHRAGTTTRFKNIAVIRPPRITITIGDSNSEPGFSAARANGTNARPVVMAVIRLGLSLTSAILRESEPWEPCKSVST
jgi:hypothetical protein